jgi:hypothetical protein
MMVLAVGLVLSASSGFNESTQDCICIYVGQGDVGSLARHSHSENLRQVIKTRLNVRSLQCIHAC